ncbi:uch2 Ubiquitin carboxyl-terminal hydrolase 2 [Candida maltosa Xu316]|uniref:Ubiquitin carboxyl-terminal hydrolase n=1 Tax=Candida maltosa (strain Xu316) TaxID=1245528 RepID=M3INH5_CANMX|nr:Ubiquitin carboxyl-terminal hydrolase, putative (Ubiquitin thioesterase, putative) [Candida maltosa Xu316]
MSDSGWNTIDSDAGVFTELVEKLGVKNIEFNDLYSIDSTTLSSLSPIHGLIFLFKYSKLDREYASKNEPITGKYDPDYLSHQVFFANQTIQNACATQAVLNILFNLTSDGVELGDELGNFREFVNGFDSEMIGETISNSDLIRSIHNSFSTPHSFIDEDKNKDKKRDDDDDGRNDGLFHFVGYIWKNGTIYELDGLKQYPIIHDESCATKEEFVDRLPKIIQERIAKYGDELRFSLLAVTNNKLNQAELLGDQEEVARQLHKRELWKRENELRKHDYTGLIVELIKNISKEKNDDEWEEFLQTGRNKTQQMIADSIRK